jgi:Uma2 family endonuclease
MPTTEPRTFRWTREQFYHLADQGFFQHRRVELIDGEILEMPVPKPAHVMSTFLAEDALRMAFGAGFWIRTQVPLNLSDATDAEPDISVVQGKPRDYPEHPTTALLVVEVSETTLDYDRDRKGSLYAAAGLADYWIINLIDSQLEVYRNPIVDPAEPFGYRYADKLILGRGDSIAPLAAPHASIAIADLLP